MKKIRVTIPCTMMKTLKEDQKYFGLQLGNIGNRLFQYYSDKEVFKLGFRSIEGKILQFNLNLANEEMYFKILQEHKVETEAEYIRGIIFTYLTNPRFKREKILFSSIVETIEQALREKRKINIKYKNEIRTLNPYFLKVSDTEDRMYIFCYCEKNNEYRNYRISNIENIVLSKNNVIEGDKNYIEGVNQNFDSFLSYGKTVKVRLTDSGKLKFDKIVENRPNLLKCEDEIFTFQCTNKLAKVYFPQFFSEVEILEPLELREWFKEQYNEILKKYS